jgi:hypothetical protein
MRAKVVCYNELLLFLYRIIGLIRHQSLKVLYMRPPFHRQFGLKKLLTVRVQTRPNWGIHLLKPAYFCNKLLLNAIEKLIKSATSCASKEEWLRADSFVSQPGCMLSSSLHLFTIHWSRAGRLKTSRAE